MTGQRDIDEALADLGQIARLALHAQAALLGHQCSALHISTAPDLAAAQASQDNPYGSTPLASLRDREHYDAGSAAEVAEGVPGWDDPLPGEAAEGVEESCSHACGYVSHGADLIDHEVNEHRKCPHCGREPLGPHAVSHKPDCPRLLSAPLCPAQWGEPPETMLCSLASGHDGNHATAEGIEWGGRWETAEPGAKDGAR